MLPIPPSAGQTLAAPLPFFMSWSHYVLLMGTKNEAERSQHGKLTIQDFEALCPSVNRRSLQRDLEGMVDKKLIAAGGATNRLVYRIEG